LPENRFCLNFSQQANSQLFFSATLCNGIPARYVAQQVDDVKEELPHKSRINVKKYYSFKNNFWK